MTPDALLSRLTELDIQHQTIQHAAVFTVSEAKTIRGRLDGAHVKNLFLRNKKGRMWLLTCLEDRQLELKALGEHLGAKRLSFASAERLDTYLGVIPGAVTPLAAINDVEGKVTVVLDEKLLDHHPLNVHPLVNTMTTAISAQDLLLFLRSTGHEPVVINLDHFLKPG